MIIIWGKGKVGQGLAEFLTYFGIKYEVIDDNECLKSGKISSKCRELLLNADLVMPSPGVPSYHPVYVQFKNKLIGELDLVRRILKENNLTDKFQFVGITGTDGKSTVSYLIYQGLMRTGKKIFLAGNFDVPFAKAVLENLGNGGIGVIEISSFMAYLLQDIIITVLAWTNFTSDHLDWHKDLKDYFVAKLNLARRAKRVLTGFDLKKIAKELDIDIDYLQWQKVDEKNWKITNPYLIGRHNQKNLALAAEVLQNFGLTSEQIKQILSGIKGLSHRIEFVGQTKWGARVRDDGKSTTAQSLGAALEAIEGSVVLISGGYDKGADFEALKDLIKTKVNFGVFLGQTAPKFAKIFDDLSIPYAVVNSMGDAVEKAMTASQNYNITNILFSPACASFDMFKNRKDRVDRFLKKVKKYLIS